MLALFCDEVITPVKQAMLDRLFNSTDLGFCKNRKGSGFGKPIFPSMSEDKVYNITDFIGPDSWGFFRILKLDTTFLHVEIGNWENEESYVKAKTIVSNLSVVNDAAERGVKLCSDFLSSAKKEENLDSILQVVENSRNAVSDQRKRKAESKAWHVSLD